MENFNFRTVSVVTNSEKGEDGFWKVVLTVTHKRSVDGKDWEEKSSLVKTFDTDLTMAINVANNSMFKFLQSLNYDLFTEAKNDSSSSSKN